MALGRGGVSAVATATGVSRPTIYAGMTELKGGAPSDAHVRKPGGGRHRLADTDPGLLKDLQRLIAPATRGDPMSPLLWTSKSTRNLGEALSAMGHEASHQTVARLLSELGYSLQVNRKTEEGEDVPDRDAQFHHINARVRCFQRRGQPVVSVDTKKKELVGNYRNSGGEWRPEGEPVRVKTKDFKDKTLGKVAPYGVYDLTANEGWVSVGVSHDTAEFAVESLRRWWKEMGRRAYPRATELLITADSGGSNGNRSRLWKLSLQHLADELGLRVSVCHFPRGTSKWNKIEHRLFCHITQNWRGRPLVSRAAVVSLIGGTRTREGLHVKSALDTNAYKQGTKVSDEQLANVRLQQDGFHGEWNYTIIPHGT
jgi:transposase